MGFATALSGLAAASANLQVIGNNIANSNTTGFKESRAEFADVYNSTGKAAAGTGVRVTEIAQQFKQGNVESTGNTLDLALSGNGGNGFFALGESKDATSATVYTRNGAFNLSPEGFITNDSGNFLMGGAPIGTTIAEGFSTGAPIALKIDTSQGVPSATTTVDLKLNLDSREAKPSTPFTGYDSTVRSGPDVNSYNSSTAATIFDSLGNTHTLTTYFVNETPDGAAESTWAAYVYLDGKGINAGSPNTLDAPGGATSTAVSAVANDTAVVVAIATAAAADVTAAATDAVALASASAAATNTSTAATAHNAAVGSPGAAEAKSKVDATKSALTTLQAAITTELAGAGLLSAVSTEITATQAAATAAVTAATNSLTTATSARDKAATALALDTTNTDLINANTAAVAAFDSATLTKSAADSALVDVNTIVSATTLAGADTAANTSQTNIDDSVTKAGLAVTSAGTSATTATTTATNLATATTNAVAADAAAATANAAAASAAATAVANVTGVSAAAIAAANTEAAKSTATAASVIAAAVGVDFVGDKIAMTFDSLGNLVADTTGTNTSGTNGADDFVFSNIEIAPVSALNVSAKPLTFSINPTGSTQYAADFGVNDLQQNGFASGNLTGVNIDKTGVVVASYSNGTTSPLGQVILGRFTNNQGLNKIGDTTWRESVDSGTVVLGVAGGNNFANITSSALENSNTDISTQLVKLIVAQQAYQANAKTISTENQIIQSILQI